MERKYEQIIKYIEKLRDENSLKQGERLPSIRSLAEKIKCNKSTVIRAYEELEMNHKIYSIPKSGYYLVEKKEGSNVHYPSIDFAEVIPDPKLLPYREFNHCINRAVELYKDSLFSYGHPQGLESLRNSLVNHFSDHQVFTSSEKIVITSGAQQALSILAKMPFPNGKQKILTEQPSYGLMQRLVELNGDSLSGIKRDFKGIDLCELERIFKEEDIKFFYTIPRFHNPLGTSYSEMEKRKIVELAEKYNVYIVEDDYLADLDPNEKVLPAHYYDISQRVVYVKSFSKTFMPGIRIGAVALHDRLIEDFLWHKRCFDLNTSVLAQGALEIFINSGMYKNHVRKTQLKYRSKMNFFKECMKTLDTSGLEFFIPDTGFFIWIKLPQEVNLGALETLLREEKVYISPASSFFAAGKSSENSFRLCISKLSRDEIRTGTEILFKEINRMQKDKVFKHTR